MTEYTIIVTIPKAGNKRVPILLDLGSQEDYPEDFFKQQKNVSLIKEEIEKQTVRNVTDPLLKKLISDIIQNIKLSRRSITVELDLPSAMPNPVSTTGTSSPDPTSLTSSPPSTSVTPKPRNRIPKPDFTQTPLPDPWSENNSPPKSREKDDSEPTIILKPKQTTPKASKPPSVSVAPSSIPTDDEGDNSSSESEETPEPNVSYETATNEPDF